MRWSVEVTSGEKTDLQKYVVEAESWQRALQAARAQRGEQGPMSGFSIELLDEGYRAVDPVTRNKFVVKRAADDAALSVPPPGAAATPKDSKAPAAPKGAPKAPAPLPSKTSVPPTAGAKSIPPAAPKPSTAPPAPAASKSIPPRPGDKKPDEKKADEKKKSRSERKSEKMKAAAIKKAETRAKSENPPPVGPSLSEPEIISDEEAPKTESQPGPAVAAEPPRKKEDSIPPAPLLPVGAFVPGLPSVKILTSREQDPSDASPLAYREYSFSVKEGTSEEVAEKVLRAQLKLVQAHLEKLKQGKLVNLAVFDVHFEGKPPVPPVCTLAWKDWKGEPVIAFPRRAGGAAKPAVKPPTPSVAPAPPVMPPASMPPQPPQASAPPPPPVVNMPPGYSQPPPSLSQTQNMGVSQVPRPPGAIAAMLGAAKAGSERNLPAAAPSEPSTTPSAASPSGANPMNQTVKDAVPPFVEAPPPPPPAAANPFSQPPPAATNPFATSPSAAPPPQGAPVGPSTSRMIPVAAAVSPPPGPTASAPPPAPPAQNPFAAPVNPFPPAGSVPPPAGSFPPPPFGASSPPTPSVPPQAPVPIMQAPIPSSPPPARRSSHPPPDGVVRTPSGRFVRGRVTGDELITQLFESMHDLHFLRDALDGGQFCLALAMEMIPVRAAIIHFFDVEKREWIVACTRGKDAGKLLTTRTPESDDLLRAAARHRRAIVTPNGSHAQAQRYQTIGGARSMIIAPIMQAGRALGAIELINPADGMPFNEDEGNAMTYIAEQYAEYLGSRGIVVQVERIRAAASA